MQRWPEEFSFTQDLYCLALLADVVGNILLDALDKIGVLEHLLDSIIHRERSLSENCSLLGTDNVRGQISVHIFAPNGGYCVYYPSNIFLQGHILEDLFSKLLNVKEILAALKILLVCSKRLLLFILTIYSG